jgi:hypothetical protein
LNIAIVALAPSVVDRGHGIEDSDHGGEDAHLGVLDLGLLR